MDNWAPGSLTGYLTAKMHLPVCRLVGPTGAPRVAQQLMSLRLSAVWALMVVFEGPVPVPGNMEGAFIKGSEVLSWAANNTAKLGVRHPSPYSNIQVWIVVKNSCRGSRGRGTHAVGY